MTNGIIIINKEKGFTSFDVVAKLRKIFNQKKIGHTGTLDPDATGVLPVCLGKATKVCDLLTDKSKTYVCTLKLGITTDTEDLSGQILSDHTKEASLLSEEEVRSAILSFLGSSSQVPPMYSALKINGKKLYELAREGKVIERKARPITISEIKITSSYQDCEISFEVSCSKGTYIRSLCRDIGERLRVGGAMKELTRVRVATFTLDQALTLSEVEAAIENGRISSYIFEPDSLFPYPKLQVREEAMRFLSNGNALTISEFLEEPESFTSDFYRVYTKEGHFAAIYQKSQKQKNQITMVKNFQ